jgi:hypothetical protein
MLGGRHGGPRHWGACLRRRQLRLPVPASRPRPWCSSAARTTATSRSRCNRLVRRRCLPCCHRLGPAQPHPQLPQRLIHRTEELPTAVTCRSPPPLAAAAAAGQDAPSPPPSRSLPRNVEQGDFRTLPQHLEGTSSNIDNMQCHVCKTFRQNHPRGYLSGFTKFNNVYNT